MGIHTRAERGPHLGMPIGKSDFDVADVAPVVASLARNVDDKDALWFWSSRDRNGCGGQYQEDL